MAGLLLFIVPIVAIGVYFVWALLFLIISSTIIYPFQSLLICLTQKVSGNDISGIIYTNSQVLKAEADEADKGESL
jgi:hypothetical protein